MACVNARRSLSTLLSHALTSSYSFPSRSCLTVALLNSSPVFIPEATKILTRTKTSGSGYSPLNDPSPKWSNRPPTVFLDGVDYEHWLIILEFPERPKPLEEENPRYCSRQVKCPVLIAWGDKDPWESIELGRTYGDFDTVEDFVVLPNVGHCPQDEAPHLVSPLVESFVSRHSKSPANASTTI